MGSGDINPTLQPVGRFSVDGYRTCHLPSFPQEKTSAPGSNSEQAS